MTELINVAVAAAVDGQHVYFSGGKTNSSFSAGREDVRECSSNGKFECLTKTRQEVFG